VATLRANISVGEHDTDNWEMVLETIEGLLYTSSQNFLNFDLLTAKNRTLRNHHLLGGSGHHVGVSAC